MLEQTIRESWTSADLDELRKRLSSLEKMSKPFYEQCQVWVHQREEAEERNERASNGADGCHPIEVAGNKSGEAMPFGAGDFGRSFQFGKVLKKLSKEDMYSRNTCSLCLDLPREAVSTEVGLSSLLPSFKGHVTTGNCKITDACSAITYFASLA